jgi:recombination protein RecA
MENKLNLAIKEIRKKYGDQTIGLVKDLDNVSLERIPTGSIYLDWAIGGGWPKGRTIELYGPYSSGKTLVALRTIASAQKEGLNCVFIDAERAFDPLFASQLGVDTNSLVLVRETGGETVFNIIESLLDSEVDLIVVDSVASLVPSFEDENPIEKQTMALQARLMSKALRKLTGKLARSNTLLIFVNQVREKVGAYGNPEITSGGRALGFYSSVRVEIRRGDWILEKKERIGHNVKFRVSKSKVCQPWRAGSFKYYYTGEFDETDEIISLGILTEKIGRRAAYYDIGDKSFRGREELLKALEEDESLLDLLKKEVLE